MQLVSDLVPEPVNRDKLVIIRALIEMQLMDLSLNIVHTFLLQV